MIRAHFGHIKGAKAPCKDKLTELDAKAWELYDISKDFAENHNIAADNRAKLIEMIATAAHAHGAAVRCDVRRGSGRRRRAGR
jgi:arylsulfatase A-like enzyme